MTRVMAVANQKGGTGKSTVTVNVAAAAADAGRRVLVVDVDPQADATTMLGVDPADRERTLYDVLVGACELPDAIARDAYTPSRPIAAGVDVAVGTERMADVELTLAGEMMREQFLADALAEHIAGYDLVLLDCPPNLGLLTVNAFVAAHEVLVVVSMVDRNAYKGAMALLDTVGKLRRKGVELAVAGVLRNQVDHHRSVYGLLNDALTAAGLPVLVTEIPLRAGFQNATTVGLPLIEFDPMHPGATAIRELTVELGADKRLREAA